MYHVLLTNRYLTTRTIPFIAVAAVALCVALVIIVVSVMTGFLEMVKSSGRTLMGDVVVSYPISGIPYYERLIARINELPDVAAATPVVDGVGVLGMPYPDGENKQSATVQFWAIDPESFAAVTGFEESLYWKPPEEGETLSELDFRSEIVKELGMNALETLAERGRKMVYYSEEGNQINGVVLGMHVSAPNERQSDGSYRPVRDWHWFMPQFEVTLTTIPLGSGAADVQPSHARLHIVNEFVSGVFIIDSNRIMIPLAEGQRLLNLDAAELVNDEGETIGIDPARATQIMVRAVEGITPEQLKPQIEEVYDAFREEILNSEELAGPFVPMRALAGVTVQTWLEQQRQFIAPVEKERELMRILFSIVYFVCAGLVLSIFWAIVYEKTRDIGILRSIGASRLGITMIFLRYGAIIGIAGSIVGLGIAYLIVHNINGIHNAMGEPAPPGLWMAMYVLAVIAFVMGAVQARTGRMLPVVLWSLAVIVFIALGLAMMFHRGTLIWDPKVYYFSRIPNDVDGITAITTMIGAVVFSVLGAFIPAAKAADTHPVEALRYE